MNIQEIATELINQCKSLSFTNARQILYHSNAKSIESDNSVTEGLDNMMIKETNWKASIDKIYGLEISAPLINGDYFSLAFTWDIQYKGQEKMIWKEIGVFHVVENKILMEKFFY